MIDITMIDKREWKEFRESGLLWFINTILHLFGWAICFEPETGEAYPSRCLFRGFDAKSNDEGYEKVTEHIKENIDDIQKAFLPENQGGSANE